MINLRDYLNVTLKRYVNKHVNFNRIPKLTKILNLHLLRHIISCILFVTVIRLEVIQFFSDPLNILLQ